MKLLTGSITAIFLGAGVATAGVIKLDDFYQETKTATCSSGQPCFINFSALPLKKGLIVRRAACEDWSEFYYKVALETLDTTNAVLSRSPVQVFTAYNNAGASLPPPDTLHLAAAGQKLRVAAETDRDGYSITCTIVGELR